MCGVGNIVSLFPFSFRQSHLSDIFMAKLVLLLSCGQRRALSTGGTRNDQGRDPLRSIPRGSLPGASNHTRVLVCGGSMRPEPWCI